MPRLLTMALAPASATLAIRWLYSDACHGAGAEARWAARDRLARLCDEAGMDMDQVFVDLGLDRNVWWATMPLSRPSGPLPPDPAPDPVLRWLAGRVADLRFGMGELDLTPKQWRWCEDEAAGWLDRDDAPAVLHPHRKPDAAAEFLRADRGSLPGFGLEGA